MKITLTVAYVGFGGNTGDGEYFFCFDKDTIIVTKQDTAITFELSSAVSKEFVVKSFLSTDVSDQFSKESKSIDNRSLVVNHRNTKPQLSFVSVLVLDTKRNKLLSCDPQVVSQPP